MLYCRVRSHCFKKHFHTFRAQRVRQFYKTLFTAVRLYKTLNICFSSDLPINYVNKINEPTRTSLTTLHYSSKLTEQPIEDKVKKRVLLVYEAHLNSSVFYIHNLVLGNISKQIFQSIIVFAFHSIRILHYSKHSSILRQL